MTKNNNQVNNGKIDLHIHSKCSDGDRTIIEILKMAQELKLSYISITDHENCIAYEQLSNINISDIYTGTLIKGCELMTSYNQKIIEILGYGVNEKIINEWYRKKYSQNEIEKRDRKLFNILLEKIEKSKIKISSKLELPEKIPYSGYFKFLTYQDMKKYKENEEFFKKYHIESYEQFIRYGLSNSESEIFINEAKEISSLKEIIDLIHKAGGVAFVAHVFKYKFDDTIQILRELIPYGIDGVECNYSTFSQTQTKQLEEFCNKNLLYKSGGSDYHGALKPNIKLGLGTESKQINENIIKTWIDKI